MYIYQPPGTTTVFTSTSWWASANNALKEISKQLSSVDDLVGRIWLSPERPAESKNPIFVHDIQYAGETIAQKLNRTTTEIKRVGATTAVISALDEVAWLFNLRGSDFPNNPFFKSYAIIHANYEVNQPELFLNLAQLSSGINLPGVQVFNHSLFWSRLSATAANPTVSRIWASPKVSQAILDSIPEGKRLLPLPNSPVQRVKARKNSVERKGMQDCQVRDGVARMKHLGWLEQQVNDGRIINETQSSDQLLIYQKQQNLFQTPSFDAISASGDRAAVIHYKAEPSTARNITKNQVYLLDVNITI
jgi:Xaa-Pro aminopeptidase